MHAEIASAFEILFDRYKNLQISVINGVFDDDLYQEQCMIFVHCIEIFEIKMSGEKPLQPFEM